MSPPDESTILSLLSDLAVRSPDAHFLSEGPTSTITYQTGKILAAKLLARRLTRLYGELPHVRIALISRNNALFPLLLWALWSRGAVAVPLSASVDPSMWPTMASVAGAKAILVTRDLRSKLDLALASSEEHRIMVTELESLIPAEHFNPEDRGPAAPQPFGLILACNRWASQATRNSDSVVEFPASPATPTVTLFTSSAVDAATLKCVTYTHRTLVYSAIRTIKALGGEAYGNTPKRHLGSLPLSHCFELCVSYCGIVLMTGGTYVLLDPRISSPSLSGSAPLSDTLIQSLVYNQPIQSLCTVPVVLDKLPYRPSSNYLTVLRSLDSLCVGGAPSPPALFDWALRENIPYADFCGATEAVGGTCIRKTTQKSVDGLEIVEGFMGVLVKNGLGENVGELVIIGEGLPDRYDNIESPAFTALGGGVTVYRTGDLYGQNAGAVERSILRGEDLPHFDVSAAPLGGLYYIGRLDDVVTLNSGVKVDALGLERVLDSLPEIRRSAVVLNAGGDALVALVEAETATSLGPTAIIDAVLRANSELPFEKRIRRDNVQIVSALPLTTKSTLHRKLIKKIIREAGGSWPREPPHPSSIQPSHLTLPATHTLAEPVSSVSEPIREELQKLISRVLSIPPPEPSLSFSDMGMTSLASVRLASAIEESFGIELKTSQLYGIRNIIELCNWILQARQQPGKPRIATSESPTVAPESNTSNALAITGASCRFPGGIDSLSSFWDALVSPQEFARSVARSSPPPRWRGMPCPDLLPMGWLEGLEQDDLASFASFFELRRSDVQGMSPNSRLALKMAYSAIEDAGISPKSLDGKAWGIFSSVNDSGWRERRLEEVGLEEYGKTWGGVADDAVGARLSYFLNLTGPAIEVKTACSSSAVAVHQACAAIRNGDCEAAIVVAVTTHFFPASSVFRRYAGIASQLGRCATFSQDADGFLPSEGAAAIIIQKAPNASGDIYAYIRGSAVTQDGRSQGFTAPNPVAQARLLTKALQQSGAGPDEISYIETHGTGTRLGDAIEIEALNQAFGPKRTRPLLIGAVKALIGHTEECAGLAGIIKSLLCFRHNAIPPQAHFSTVNEELDLFASKLVVPRRVTSFVESRTSRLIGVSSFGLSGTLAHVVLQEPPQSPPRAPIPDQGGIFVMSARSASDLTASVSSWLAYIDSPLSREVNLEDVCFTAQTARDVFAYRRAWPVSGWRALRVRLEAASKARAPARAPRNPTVSFWFAAPRSKEDSIAHIDHPTYRSTLAECAAAYAYGALPSELQYYASQLALARTLASSGCKITAVGGDGPGEFVAAAFAGVFDTASLFNLLAAMEPLHAQEAVSFDASHDTVLERLTSFAPQELRVRAQHGEGRVTLIGTRDAAQRFRALNEDLVCFGAHFALSLYLRQSVPFALAWGRYPVASAYVGSVLEEGLLLTPAYWNGVLEREYDAQGAWDALSERSTCIVSLGGGELVPPNAIWSAGNSADALLARLFEAGCELDWKSLRRRGTIVHLPTYQWALDAKA